MSFSNGDRVKHEDGWSGKVVMVMPEVPGVGITVKVMRMNTGEEVDIPASELIMNMPSSGSNNNTLRNNVPQIGGRKSRKSRKGRKSRKSRKDRK